MVNTHLSRHVFSNCIDNKGGTEDCVTFYRTHKNNCYFVDFILKTRTGEVHLIHAYTTIQNMIENNARYVSDLPRTVWVHFEPHQEQTESWR